MNIVRATAAVVLASLGCGTDVRVEPPDGELLLYVDTDAPLASAAGGRPGVDAPAPLFDRLRIEVFAPDATTPCDGCVNEFPLDADRMRALAMSVGVAPTPGVSGFRARVRMFLAAHAKDGEPNADATVDVTIALPVVEETGRSIVSVTLHTDDVGKRVGSLDAPVDADDGPPDASLVGTWDKAQRTPCRAAPPDGAVCIPGGAFWMGGRRGPWTYLPSHDTLAPRLVVLSPFYLDAHEVTVETFRKTHDVSEVRQWTGGTDATDIDDFCNFTSAPGVRDAYPVNCVSWGVANAHCASRGATLPSEAQWEYAASGLVGSTYVWGEDPPACDDAVFSRTGWGVFHDSVANCKPPAPPGGSVAIGSGQRDRLVMPTGTVTDLIGNVSEWMRDRWNRSTEKCWSRPGVYVDPVCQGPAGADGALRSARGGDWLVTNGQLAHTVRIGAPDLTLFYSPELGFRCASK